MTLREPMLMSKSNAKTLASHHFSRSAPLLSSLQYRYTSIPIDAWVISFGILPYKDQQ